MCNKTTKDFFMFEISKLEGQRLSSLALKKQLGQICPKPSKLENLKPKSYLEKHNLQYLRNGEDPY
jgi:hypothetical protein